MEECSARCGSCAPLPRARRSVRDGLGERGGLVHLVRGATRATTELKEALVAAASKAEVQPVRAAAPPRRCAVHRGRGRF